MSSKLLRAGSSKRMHAVDGQKEAASYGTGHGLRIVTLTSDRFRSKLAIESEGFSNKRACCCFPLVEGFSAFEARHGKLSDEKLAIYALALDADTGEAIGMCDLGFSDLRGESEMPSWMRHPYKGGPKECYVEKLAVLSKARGMGVGGALIPSQFFSCVPLVYL